MMTIKTQRNRFQLAAAALLPGLLASVVLAQTPAPAPTPTQMPAKTAPAGDSLAGRSVAPAGDSLAGRSVADSL
jgi:hypothetical protein